MYLRDLIKQFLKDGGYDGLYNLDYTDEPCSCTVDDLIHCEDPNFDESYNRWLPYYQ